MESARSNEEPPPALPARASLEPGKRALIVDMGNFVYGCRFVRSLHSTPPTSSLLPQSCLMIYTTRNLDRIFVSKADSNLQESKPISVPNRGTEKKFCTANGTILLSDLKKCKLDFENGTVHFKETHAASLKDILIWNCLMKHGLKPEKLRQKLQSEANDSTLFGYAAAAVHSVLLSLPTTSSVGPPIDKVFKRTTSPIVRKVLTEHVDPFDEQVRLKDLFDLLKEKHDLAIVGKTTSKIYAELRICLSFLRHFANAGKVYPEGW